MNTGATMTESFYKSLRFEGGIKMAEEEKKIVEKVEEPIVVEGNKAEEVKEAVVEPTKEVIEPIKEEEVKAEEPAVEVEEEKILPLDQLKSLKEQISNLQSSNDSLKTELKSVITKLNKPQLKAVANTKVETQDIKFKPSNMLDLI